MELGTSHRMVERGVTGLTMVLDRLYGLSQDEFSQVAKFVDIVEIGWGLPLIWDEGAISSRIKFYNSQGVIVSMSGTILEYYSLQNQVDHILDKAQRMGFGIVEVSDGIVDLSLQQKERLASAVRNRKMECIVAVGKKDPLAQLSLAETLSQIEAARRIEPLKTVVEGRELGRGVGIYDENGAIKWSMLRAISGRFDHRDLIFEAPFEAQQAALISELGPDVNLGNVALSSIAALQSERLGLRFDTFGVKKTRDVLSAGPSVKFVLFAIREYQPLDQRELASITGLPRRTIQKAIEYLVSNNVITQHPNYEDMRSKIYRTPRAAPRGRRR